MYEQFFEWVSPRAWQGCPRTTNSLVALVLLVPLLGFFFFFCSKKNKAADENINLPENNIATQERNAESVRRIIINKS
jgi:hypothetical protein